MTVLVSESEPITFVLATFAVIGTPARPLGPIASAQDELNGSGRHSKITRRTGDVRYPFHGVVGAYRRGACELLCKASSTLSSIAHACARLRDVKVTRA